MVFQGVDGCHKVSQGYCQRLLKVVLYSVTRCRQWCSKVLTVVTRCLRDTVKGC